MKQSSSFSQQEYSIDLVLDRGNSTYKPQQQVTGIIRMGFKHSNSFRVDVSMLTIMPVGMLTFESKQNKRMESLGNVPTVKLLELGVIEIAKNKTINQETQLAFRFKLAKGDHRYLQTYVGCNINVVYEIRVHAKLQNGYNINNNFPFYIQVPKQGRETIQQFVYPKKKTFMIRSQDIKGNKVPKFKIRGQLESQIIYFAEDLNGTIIIDQAETPIRSIDVQMYRVEKVTHGSETVAERTQIQLIQMCDGNVTRNMEIPIYMILPRYYSCPSVKYLWCQLDFQIDLQIIFRDGFKVTVNIPLKLIRS